MVVTVAKGYDLGHIWKTQGEAAERRAGGYYINATQAGEPPGPWWGPGAQALGLTPGQIVQPKPYEAIYQQIDPRAGAKLGRPRGRYPTFADHLARLRAAESHVSAERLVEPERQAAQATRQPAAYTDVTVSFSKSMHQRFLISVGRELPRTGPGTSMPYRRRSSRYGGCGTQQSSSSDQRQAPAPLLNPCPVHVEKGVQAGGARARGRPVTGPAARSQQAQPSEPARTDRTVMYASFRQAEAPGTWTADAAHRADSPVPYTLTAKAETLLEETGSPTTPLRKGHACGMNTRSPQAESGLSGQERTYVTEISLPPSDSGIHRLHARMTEPEPEPEAGL